MYSRVSLSILAGALLAVPASSQNEAGGYLKGLTTSWVTRGYSAAKASDGARFSNDMFRGIGPITGVTVYVHDFVATTKDNIAVSINQESTATSNLPNIQTPLIKTGIIPLVPGKITVTFKGPVTVPKGRDFWIATEFQSPIGVNNDGGFSFFLRGDLATAASRDIPGPGILLTGNVLADRLMAFWTPTQLAPATSTLARQFWSEPLHDATKGVGGATIVKTNQATQSGTGNDFVIAGMLSASNPDLYDARKATPARADQFGFCVTGNLVKNNPVLFFVAAKFGADISGGVITRGVFSLDLGSLFYIVTVPGSASGMARFLVPPVPELSKATIFWGALVFDVKKLELTASPSARQRL